MRGIKFELYGHYGHFKQPQTNNNPCTFAYMHKVAAIGFLGAVIGIEREEMKLLYPQMCEDLIYSIKILNEIIKEPHAFTKRSAMAQKFYEPGRRFCEYLREPKYEIIIGLKNERSQEQFDKFLKFIKNDQSVYPTYFGSVNCPAFVKYIEDVDISDEQSGEFLTNSVISEHHSMAENDFISERVPTNQPKSMFYSDWVLTVCVQGDPILVKGPYRKVGQNLAWFM